MKIKNEIDVEEVAKLANLKLSGKESIGLQKQLSEVIVYISKLDEIDTKKVEPIGHITGKTNVTREDATAPSLTQEEALKNAPKVKNGFFEVPGILENQ